MSRLYAEEWKPTTSPGKACGKVGLTSPGVLQTDSCEAAPLGEGGVIATIRIRTLKREQERKDILSGIRSLLEV